MKLNTSIVAPLSKMLLIPTICLNNHSGTGCSWKKLSVLRNLKIIFYRKAECSRSWASSLLLFLGVQGLNSLLSTLMRAAHGRFWICDFSRAITSIRLSPYKNLTWRTTAQLSQHCCHRRQEVMQGYPYPPILLFRLTLWVARTAIKRPQASSDA